MSPESHTGVPETDAIKAVRQYRRTGMIDPDHAGAIAEFRSLQYKWDRATLPEESIEVVQVEVNGDVAFYHPDGERYVTQWLTASEDCVIPIERESHDEGESE